MWSCSSFSFPPFFFLLDQICQPNNLFITNLAAAGLRHHRVSVVRPHNHPQHRPLANARPGGPSGRQRRHQGRGKR